MKNHTIDDMDTFIKLAMTDTEEEEVLPDWRRPKSAAYRRERRKKIREAAERGEFLPYHKKRGNMKYRRAHLTERDQTVLTFLATVRMATAAQIAEVLGVQRQSAHHRLRGLHEWGMVGKLEIYQGAPNVFILTGKGRQAAKKQGWLREHEGNGDSIDTIGITGLMHHLGGTQAVLHLLSAFPEIKREYIMNELEIQRISKNVHKAGDMCSQKRGAIMGDFVKRDAAIRDGVSYWDASMTYGGIWYTYDATQIKRATHRPDFVVNGEAFCDKAGKALNASLAIEVELSLKDDDYLEDIIRGYMNTGSIYNKVIYFYNKEKIKEKFHSVAQRIGIDMERFEKRFHFIALPEQRSTLFPMARMGVME